VVVDDAEKRGFECARTCRLELKANLDIHSSTRRLIKPVDLPVGYFEEGQCRCEVEV